MIGRIIGHFVKRAALAVMVLCALFSATLAQPRYDAPARGQRMMQAQRPPSVFERPPPPSTGFSLRRLFGLEDPPPQLQTPPRTMRQPRARPKPVVRQERTKPEAENRIVVFGDWLADGLALGLDEAFADMSNIGIARRTRSETGLLREEWPKIVSEYLDQKQKNTLVVVSLGMADRSISSIESDGSRPDSWKDVYGQRIDALMAVFAAHNIPVVWIGLPPVKDEAATARFAAVNAILRERVGRGGVYVDIWPGFVDEDNRYVPVGPDAGGQPAKLRNSDGVHFTRKGIDKIAAYAAVEIRRLLGAGTGTKDVPTALPGSGNEPFADIDKSVQHPSEPGPAVPLTRSEVSPNGVLLKGKTDLNAAGALQRAFRTGLPVAPVKGRMDDPSPTTQ